MFGRDLFGQFSAARLRGPAEYNRIRSHRTIRPVVGFRRVGSIFHHGKPSHGMPTHVGVELQLELTTCQVETTTSAGMTSPMFSPRPPRRRWSDDQVSGSSANAGLVGATDPPGGSTVKASVLDVPRSGSTAVVDGATDLASMVPADCGPLSPTNHIW